jgi:hypothetical protein
MTAIPTTGFACGICHLPTPTYYYRVKTVDAGLKESAWSATGSLYTLVASSVAVGCDGLGGKQCDNERPNLIDLDGAAEYKLGWIGGV